MSQKLVQLLNELRTVFPPEVHQALDSLLTTLQYDITHPETVTLAASQTTTDAARVKLWVQNGADARFQGRALGAICWAKLTSATYTTVVTPAGLETHWAEGQVCDDNAGRNPHGQRRSIRLLTSGGKEPAIAAGDVLGCFWDQAGVLAGVCSCAAATSSSGVAEMNPLFESDVTEEAGSRGYKTIRNIRAVCLQCPQRDGNWCTPANNPLATLWTSGTCPKGLWQ